jgi:hypothetical protein
VVFEEEFQSGRADEIGVPFVRCNTFVNEKVRLRIVFLLDGSELVIVGAKERFLPVELISRSLKKATGSY